MVNEENELEKYLNWMNEKNTDFDLWMLDEVLGNSVDLKVIYKMFSKDQARFIRGLVKAVIRTMEWHNKKDLGAHKEIVDNVLDRLDFLEEQFAGHRHEFTKTYSSKPE